jgi:hypothetical protein
MIAVNRLAERQRNKFGCTAELGGMVDRLSENHRRVATVVCLFVQLQYHVAAVGCSHLSSGLFAYLRQCRTYWLAFVRREFQVMPVRITEVD